MKNPKRFAKEFQLLEHTHYALSCARNTEEFYTIVTGILVSPQAFNFQRAFILKIDERHMSAQAGFQFTSPSVIDTPVSSKLNQLHVTPPAHHGVNEIRRLYDAYLETLTNHSVCDISDSGHNQFPGLIYKLKQLPAEHVLNQIIDSPAAQKYDSSMFKNKDIPFLSGEFLAGCLTTRKGRHGILIVDNEGGIPIEEGDLLRFQWFLTHASMTLSNIELIEQLTFQSRQVHEMEKLKNNFLSIVSHELLTPLTTISGYLNLLADDKFGELNTKQDDVIHTVLQHSNHLTNMVNDLLEIAEVNSGGITDAEIQPVYPVTAIANVLPKLQMRKSGKSIEIHFHPPPTIPKILTDPQLLERIIYHLLDNALKFAPQGSCVEVKIEVIKSEVEIQIHDCGIGISQKNLKRIFDHFYQVDFTLDRQFGGMGIGLTIVKLMLDASGGKMRIISKPNEGSMFAIRYPIAV